MSVGLTVAMGWVRSDFFNLWWVRLGQLKKSSDQCPALR